MTANLDSVSTIPAMLDLAASRYGDRAFIVDGGITLSFSDTAKLAEQVAAGLVSSGFDYGDRAAIWAPNCADWIVAALGILSAGGVLVTVNTRYKGAEAANIVNDSGAKVAFVIDHFLDTDYAEELSRHSTPTLEQVVSISLDSPDRAGNGLSVACEQRLLPGSRMALIASASSNRELASVVSRALIFYLPRAQQVAPKAW